MNAQERSKYLKVPLTLRGQPARISGTALDRAEIYTTERDRDGDFYFLRIPWDEAIKIIERGGVFYGGKRRIPDKEQYAYFVGFVIGVATVIFVQAVIDAFTR